VNSLTQNVEAEVTMRWLTAGQGSGLTGDEAAPAIS
jgi:hypothetical protein